MDADILVPTLGESVTSATVERWLKQPGETVSADEPLVELETDKVTVEVNAPASGTLAAQQAAEGAEVQVGSVLGSVTKGPKVQHVPAKPPESPPPVRGAVAPRHCEHHCAAADPPAADAWRSSCASDHQRLSPAPTSPGKLENSNQAEE